ncbi:STAS domain-containing protein [Marinobacter alexandrii]|uniref:STAS domain-containing protein n=1 Tax=Marinobacter alexandrii TaxID=2570351 RepID=UPI001FFE4D6A|nr:STAS domain-containing protein [Marinobacter alexandrii]MCK2150110.1 STAS domain-containing protein [Marinobacter alexandrii]
MAPRVEMTNDILVVTGDVDAESVVALRSKGEAVIRSAAVDLTVDLEGLETAHSVVLSMLLCWQRLAASLSVDLTYRGVSERLLSLAALSHLDDHLPGFTR